MGKLSDAIKDLMKVMENTEVLKHLNIAYLLQKQDEESPK